MIDEIRRKIATGAFEFSKHAVDQSILRQISVGEVREVMAVGEIIEDYPVDKYGPSCLVLGYARATEAVACAMQLSVAAFTQDHYALRTRPGVVD